MRRIRMAGASLAGSLALVGLLAAPAAADSNSATVNITDSGFQPASVSVPLNGTVTFSDTGANVHTATSLGGVQTPFDSGGLATGQSYSFIFTMPGTYQFTSATDCMNGNATPGFNCTAGTVTVGATPAPSAQPAASSASSAATKSGEPVQVQPCTYITDPTHPDLYCPSDTSNATIVVPAGPNGGGGSTTYTFNYPGDNSNILLTADVVSTFDATMANGIGASVYDNTATNGAPVETDTLMANQFAANPDMFRVAYSSGTAGPVTVAFTNWTGKPITLQVNQSGLIHTDGSTAPVTLQLGSVSPQLA
ncbi:MAG TPA: hypothetical protein VFS62_05840 [Chloroflexota bacterium]|nr:hypothetical protein [Chloroflexota bacterium]